MEIHLQVDTVQPPSGRVVATDGDVAAFDGWLDLMRVLSELLEASPDHTPGAPTPP